MKLSIIIPAYNVERYIEKTLRSILNQDYDKSEVEIIVVIDGSPDNSETIVRSLAKEGFDINIIVQDNLGLSAARNNGMKRSIGDYVWFVDSDDWLSAGSLNTLLKLLDGSVDEVDFGAIEISDDEKSINKIRIKDKQPYSMSGLEIWKHKNPHIATAQLSVYRRKFLIDNNLYFYEGIYHEDFEFCPRASLLSKKTISLNFPIYYKRVNPNSITQTANPKKSYDYIVAAQSLCSFIQSQKVTNIIKRRFYYFIAMAINNALFNMRQCNEQEKKSFNHYLDANKKIFTAYLKSYRASYILEMALLYLSNGKYVETYARFK